MDLETNYNTGETEKRGVGGVKNDLQKKKRKK